MIERMLAAVDAASVSAGISTVTLGVAVVSVIVIALVSAFVAIRLGARERLRQLSGNRRVILALLAAWIATAAIAFFMVLEINNIVNYTLYNFGLQGSPVWADPYVTYFWLSFYILIISIALSLFAIAVVFAGRGRSARPSNLKVENKQQTAFPKRLESGIQDSDSIHLAVENAVNSASAQPPNVNIENKPQTATPVSQESAKPEDDIYLALKKLQRARVVTKPARSKINVENKPQPLILTARKDKTLNKPQPLILTARKGKTLKQRESEN